MFFAKQPYEEEIEALGEDVSKVKEIRLNKETYFKTKLEIESRPFHLSSTEQSKKRFFERHGKLPEMALVHRTSTKDLPIILDSNLKKDWVFVFEGEKA